MLKKIGAAVAVLALGVGLGTWQAQASQAPAAAPTSMDGRAVMDSTGPSLHAVLPFEGSYLGHDMYGQTVRFKYRRHQMHSFTVNSTTFRDAYVSGGAWLESCSEGLCTKGTWTDDLTVEGQWRDKFGHLSHWTAHLYAH